MSTQSNTLSERRRPPSPLDIGVSFVYRHKRMFLALGTVQIIWELAIAYFFSSGPMDERRIFLLGVLHLLMNVWMVTAMTMFIVEFLQERRVALLPLARRALILMPKVFLSYIGLLVMLVIVGKFATLLLLLVTLFLWAPFFCVLDLYVQKAPAEDDEESDYEEEPLSRAPERAFYVGARSMFDFGYLRAVSFSMLHLSYTFQLALLLLFANIVPVALASFLIGAEQSFPSQLVQVLLASLANVVVIGAGIAAFISLLPMTVKRELKLQSDIVSSLAIDGSFRFFNFSTNPLTFVLLTAVTVPALYYLQHVATVQSRIPDGIEARVERAVQEGESFVVRLRLADKQHSFRWLESKQFRLHMPLENPKEVGKTKEIEPERVLPFSEAGEPFAGNGLFLYGENVELRFFFRVPEEIAPEGSFRLSYPGKDGKEKTIVEGSYSLKEPT